MNVAILFAGQGAQYPGMGKSLCDISATAKEVFETAGSEIKNWCFEGSKEDLQQTSITQPTVYTVTMAAWAALSEMLTAYAEKVKISAVAGFSMGEYAALTAAKAIPDFETGLSLVRKRGELMAEAGVDEAGNPKGAMLAIAGGRDAILAAVESVRGDGILEAVNFNAPTQTAVAGDIPAIERLKEAVKETPGLRATPLRVSTAFHSPMMAPAAEKFAAALQGVNLKAPAIPVYSNITGSDIMEEKPEGMDDGEWLKSRMALQLKSPVRWQETIENMKNGGIDLFIEVGPGKTLSGLVKKTAEGATVFRVEDEETLAELQAFLAEA